MKEGEGRKCKETSKEMPCSGWTSPGWAAYLGKRQGPGMRCGVVLAFLKMLLWQLPATSFILQARESLCKWKFSVNDITGHHCMKLKYLLSSLMITHVSPLFRWFFTWNACYTCSDLCSAHHYRDRAHLVVLAQEEMNRMTHSECVHGLEEKHKAAWTFVVEAHGWFVGVGALSLLKRVVGNPLTGHSFCPWL